MVHFSHFCQVILVYLQLAFLPLLPSMKVSIKRISFIEWPHTPEATQLVSSVMTWHGHDGRNRRTQTARLL